MRNAKIWTLRDKTVTEHLWGHVFAFPCKGNKCSSHQIQTAAADRQISCVLGWLILFQVNPQIEFSRGRCVKLKNGRDFIFNWIYQDFRHFNSFPRHKRKTRTLIGISRVGRADKCEITVLYFNYCMPEKWEDPRCPALRLLQRWSCGCLHSLPEAQENTDSSEWGAFVVVNLLQMWASIHQHLSGPTQPGSPSRGNPPPPARCTVNWNPIGSYIGFAAKKGFWCLGAHYWMRGEADTAPAQAARLAADRFFPAREADPPWQMSLLWLSLQTSIRISTFPD